MQTRDEPNKNTNNALHEAILKPDNETALKLVRSMKIDELNQKSLGNTPLMLALKTANFAVARAILNREDMSLLSDTDLTSDGRGISLLQLACAWRDNETILLVLDKYKAAGMSTNIRFDLNKLTGVNLFHKKAVANRTLAKIYGTEYDPEKIRNAIKINDYHKSIIESPALSLDTAPELTDALLFHSKLICLNLGVLNADDFKDYPSSHLQFAHDLMTGYNAILKCRNAKPIDARVVEIIGSDDPKPTATAPKLREL